MIDEYSSLMQISARTTSMANKDSTCFKVLKRMSKKETCQENLIRNTPITAIYLEAWKNNDGSIDKQCQTKAYLLDIF